MLKSMSKPYPKRAKHSDDATGYPPGEGGLIPTRTLQYSSEDHNGGG